MAALRHPLWCAIGLSVLGLPLAAPARAQASSPAATQPEMPAASQSAPAPWPVLEPQPSSVPMGNVALDSAAAEPPPDGDAPVAKPRYVVEHIIVKGLQYTAEEVVLQRVAVRAGEVLDDEVVEVTRLRLLATGFFVDVKVRLTRGSEHGLVLLVVEVSERLPLPTVDGLYLGFSETTPVFGGVSLSQPNLLGRGVEVGGALVLAPDQQSYRLRLASGPLFGTPLGARLTLLLLRGREPVAFGDDPRAGGHVAYLRAGGVAGLSVSAGNAQSFSVEYHGEYVRGDPRLSPRVRRTPAIEPGDSMLSVLQLSYLRDTRDRGFVPTSGARLWLGVDLSSALLLSGYEYSRYQLVYEQYIPTFQDHSFMVRLDAGFMQNGVARDNAAGAPFFEAFYIGDYSYFRRGRNSLPRQLGLNLSAFSVYDDILGSATVSYALPLYKGGDLFYRTYVYGAVNVCEGTTLRELQGHDPADDRFPVTLDAGLKLDTVVGSFVLSASYLVDLVF